MKKFVKATLIGIGLGIIEASALLCLQKHCPAQQEKAEEKKAGSDKADQRMQMINPAVGPNTPQSRIQNLTPHA